MFFIRNLLWTLVLGAALFAQDVPKIDYKVLASNRTSTMEKEMNAAAEAGYIFGGVMGGETAFGGKEVVVVMMKAPEATPAGDMDYKLLATNRTSTMLKELQQAGEQGYEYRGQTIFESTFGGEEVSIILERNADAPVQKIEYWLLATSKTSTMQKELQEAGAVGFKLLGMGVGKTSLGGNEVVCVLERRSQ